MKNAVFKLSSSFSSGSHHRRRLGWVLRNSCLEFNMSPLWALHLRQLQLPSKVRECELTGLFLAGVPEVVHQGRRTQATWTSGTTAGMEAEAVTARKIAASGWVSERPQQSLQGSWGDSWHHAWYWKLLSRSALSGSSFEAAGCAGCCKEGVCWLASLQKCWRLHSSRGLFHTCVMGRWGIEVVVSWGLQLPLVVLVASEPASSTKSVWWAGGLWGSAVLKE